MLLTLLAEELAKDKKPRSYFACLRMDRPLGCVVRGPDSCIGSSQCQRLMNVFLRAASGARLTFAVSIARGLELPAALVARAGDMIEWRCCLHMSLLLAPSRSMCWRSACRLSGVDLTEACARFDRRC